MQCVYLLAVLFACYCHTEAANWALLVAGSHTYSNYRHQADVCHSYQILRQHGFPSDHIVVMMADDIAYNARNPYKGNIINVPGGPNVYSGIQIDYRGNDVTPQNFLKVLQGDYRGMRGIGTSKVIASGPGDHVFVYYADHGNKELIGFPHGVLYSRDLNNAITNMHNQNKYGKMVFYIEACFSGSMFRNHLRSDINVYAITAANERESSYSCYYDRVRRAALADEFSIRWMQDSEKSNFNSHTLNQQFVNVRSAVRNSHVMQYGDTYGMGGMSIGQFQSNSRYSDSAKYPSFEYPEITDAMPTWQVPYMSLFYQLQDANTTEARMELLHEMQVEQQTQLKIKESMKSIVGKLVPHVSLMMKAQTKETSADEYHCYELAVEKYLDTCKAFEGYDYAMRDLHVFSNLCNSGEAIERISEAIEEVCA